MLTMLKVQIMIRYKTMTVFQTKYYQKCVSVMTLVYLKKNQTNNRLKKVSWLIYVSSRLSHGVPRYWLNISEGVFR